MGPFEAVLLAHWPAVRVLLHVILGEEQRHGPTLARLTISLAVCISRAPKWLALDPELTQLFDRCLDSAGEVSIVGCPCIHVFPVHGAPAT